MKSVMNPAMAPAMATTLPATLEADSADSATTNYESLEDFQDGIEAIYFTKCRPKQPLVKSQLTDCLFLVYSLNELNLSFTYSY